MKHDSACAQVEPYHSARLPTAWMLDKYSFGVIIVLLTRAMEIPAMVSGSDGAMSNLEFHVLLALAGGPRYGYAIKDAVAEESAGTLTPRAGSLYRVLARLMTSGLVREVEPAAGTTPPHPGLERRYYALTSAARAELAAETRRRKRSAALAERRLGIAQGG